MKCNGCSREGMFEIVIQLRDHGQPIWSATWHLCADCVTRPQMVEFKATPKSSEKPS